MAEKVQGLALEEIDVSIQFLHSHLDLKNMLRFSYVPNSKLWNKDEKDTTRSQVSEDGRGLLPITTPYKDHYSFRPWLSAERLWGAGLLGWVLWQKTAQELREPKGRAPGLPGGEEGQEGSRKGRIRVLQDKHKLAGQEEVR